MKKPQNKQPSFFDLWMRHQFSLHLLAKEASVEQYTIELMHNLQPVTREDAQKVLAILEKCYNDDYSLETVFVPLIEDVPIPPQKSEMVRLLEDIDARAESSMLGLYGPATVARHEIICNRQAHIAEYIEYWKSQIGEEKAIRVYSAYAEKANIQQQGDNNV